MTALVLLSCVLLGLGAAGVVLLRVKCAVVISAGIAAAVFSGQWGHLGLPIPVDRVLIYFGLLLLLLGAERSQLPVRLRFRSQHVLMIVLSVYALLSSLIAGTLLSAAEGHYALMDRLSITGFVLFTAAPLVFHDRRTRNIFLVVMVATGAYLGLTSLLEGLGAKDLAWPSYISDPNVGIHIERARGPMVESAGFGLALFECAVAGVVAFRLWHTRSAKVVAVLVTITCLAGTLFTLTRAVWIGVILGLAAASVVSREWRRRLIPVAGLLAVVLLVVVSMSPTIQASLEDRSTNERAIWDRINLADAGLRAVEENPVFGVGWRNFVQEGDEYFRLLPNIPQTGTGIDIHNAVLSTAAELGIVGAALWLAVVFSTIGAAVFWRAPPELEDWRVGMVAMGTQWAVVAMFTPFSYTFSFLFVYAWAGIVTAHHFVQPRDRAAPRSSISQERPAPPAAAPASALQPGAR
jgi:putative inorganic carbon (HCO3(-)) transporter